MVMSPIGFVKNAFEESFSCLPLYSCYGQIHLWSPKPLFFLIFFFCLNQAIHSYSLRLTVPAARVCLFIPLAMYFYFWFMFWPHHCTNSWRCSFFPQMQIFSCLWMFKSQTLIHMNKMVLKTKLLLDFILFSQQIYP